MRLHRTPPSGLRAALLALPHYVSALSSDLRLMKPRRARLVHCGADRRTGCRVCRVVGSGLVCATFDAPASVNEDIECLGVFDEQASVEHELIVRSKVHSWLTLGHEAQ